MASSPRSIRYSFCPPPILPWCPSPCELSSKLALFSPLLEHSLIAVTALETMEMQYLPPAETLHNTSYDTSAVVELHEELIFTHLDFIHMVSDEMSKKEEYRNHIDFLYTQNLNLKLPSVSTRNLLACQSPLQQLPLLLLLLRPLSLLLMDTNVL